MEGEPYHAISGARTRRPPPHGATYWSFLLAHPSVRLHFTPTYSSWLNQVELWFSKIERDVTARGIFTSVPDLRRKLMRYITHYNKTAAPIRCCYADPRGESHDRCTTR